MYDILCFINQHQAVKKRLFLMLPVFFVACTATQKIAYRTDDIPASKAQSIPISVEIKVLDDHRYLYADNDLLFTQPVQTRVYGVTTCINAEKHYKDTVVNQISRLMAEHFGKAKLFQKVSFKENSPCDYYLTASLNSFYAEQAYSSVPANSAVAFGMVGVVATSRTKTPGKIIIDVSDIRLYRKDGTLVKNMGSLTKEYIGSFVFNGSCGCVYWHANEKLKDFNTHLIEKIRTELSDIAF